MRIYAVLHSTARFLNQIYNGENLADIIVIKIAGYQYKLQHIYYGILLGLLIFLSKILISLKKHF